jgi:hypothetical protein
MKTISIPPQIIGYTRESLCRQLGQAADQIAQISEARGCEHGERYAKPIQRFDRIRALLELIGWTDREDREVVRISRPRERATLRQALRAQLRIEREMAMENPNLIGAKRQIKIAKRRIREIESFLSELRVASDGNV